MWFILHLQINELAQNYPALLKFQSTDVSPYSWMAIAWYVWFYLLFSIESYFP